MKSNVLIAHHKDVAAYNKQKKTRVFKGFKGFIEQNTQEIRSDSRSVGGDADIYLFQDLGRDSLKRFEDYILDGLEGRLNDLAQSTEKSTYTYNKEALKDILNIEAYDKESYDKPISWSDIKQDVSDKHDAMNVVQKSFRGSESTYTPSLPFKHYHKTLHLADTCLTNPKLIKKNDGQLTYITQDGFTSYNQVFSNPDDNRSACAALSDVCRLTSFAGTTDKIHETFNNMKLQGYSSKRQHRLAFEKTNAFWAQKAIMDHGKYLYKDAKNLTTDNSMRNIVTELNTGLPTDGTNTAKVSQLIHRTIFSDNISPDDNDIISFKNHLRDNNQNNILLDTVKSLTSKHIDENNSHHLLYALYIGIMHNEVMPKTKSPPEEFKNLCKLLAPHHDFVPDLRKNHGRPLDKNSSILMDQCSIFRDNSSIKKGDQTSHIGLVHEYWDLILDRKNNDKQQSLKETLGNVSIPLECLPINTILMLETRAKTAAKLFLWDLIQDYREDNQDNIPGIWKTAIDESLKATSNKDSNLYDTILRCEHIVTPQKDDLLSFDSDTSSRALIMDTLNATDSTKYIYYCERIYRDINKNPISEFLSSVWGTLVNTFSTLETKESPNDITEISEFMSRLKNIEPNESESADITDSAFAKIQTRYVTTK